MPAIAANATGFLYNSDYPMDKLILGATGSIITAGGGGSSSPSIAHNLGFGPLYLLKWSTSPTFDTSYDELGVSTINNLQLAAQTDATNLYLFSLNNTGSTTTFYYRVTYSMPTNVDQAVTASQGSFDNFVLNTDFNYPKIYLQDVTSTATQTVDHNLGYYPHVEVWYERVSDGRIVHHIANDVAGTSTPKARVTTSQLILSDTSGTVSKWHYKIYWDEI